MAVLVESVYFDSEFLKQILIERTSMHTSIRWHIDTLDYSSFKDLNLHKNKYYKNDKITVMTTVSKY